MKKVLKREIVIPVGTKLETAPTSITLIAPHYEILIGIGNDETMSVYISEDALKELEEYKNEIKL